MGTTFIFHNILHILQGSDICSAFNFFPIHSGTVLYFDLGSHASDWMINFKSIFILWIGSNVWRHLQKRNFLFIILLLQYSHSVGDEFNIAWIRALWSLEGFWILKTLYYIRKLNLKWKLKTVLIWGMEIIANLKYQCWAIYIMTGTYHSILVSYT